MAETWVISDTHFQHANILKFKDEDGNAFRGDRFKDVSHMDETMIENWNRVVGTGDTIYHLGDVFFGSKEGFQKIWPRLNGKKRLILGNHDDPKFLAPFFQKIEVWRVWNDLGIVFSHVPLHESALMRGVEKGGERLINVHGHIHQNASPRGPYRCVCVEHIDYTPIHIEKLRRA